MKRYVIERELPGVGGMTRPQLAQAAAKSNDALAQLGGSAQWIQSFVAEDKTFCVYLAESEAAVREHARLSRIPRQQGHRDRRHHRSGHCEGDVRLPPPPWPAAGKQAPAKPGQP